jgi:starch-binding outer membrane protein, SusD/RagB family
MKFNKIIPASLIVALLGVTIISCEKSFLDENLTTKYSTDRFKTQDGLDELVTGAYQKLKFKFNYIWGIEMFNLGVDEFTDANNSIPSFNCYSADLNSAETGANSPLWDNMYSGIESANTIIKNVPLYYDNTSSNYDTRLGEGYFLRGYFYLQLVVQYGGVPLKLNPSTSVETYFTRDSEEDCFAQIISDLEEAYSLLPTSPDATGRITKSAAAHYLAKAHLTRASELYSSWNSSYVANDLDAVITYGQEVIEAHPLCDDYVSLWDFQYANGTNENVSEVVLAAQFSDDQTTWGRYGNQMHLYYPSVYQDIAGTKRDISGDREFSYARTTNYTMDVFDRVNDSRFWKSFITGYGCNNPSGAPAWNTTNWKLAPDTINPIHSVVYNSVTGKNDTTWEKRFAGGELAIKYIVNDAGDNRYLAVTGDATGVIKIDGMCPTHTFVRYFDGESQAWVGKHGNEGYYGIQKRSVALSKYRDGYRIAIASQFGTRDAIMARSAEDVLMVAEAYIRQGESQYDNAIFWINKLRDRATFKSGENRSRHIDGGQAYKNNTYCAGLGGGFSAAGAIYWEKNTYYESNNDMAPTTASSDLHINSIDDIYNSAVDAPIYNELGCTSNADKMMCFLLNERTRELCGETYRWEDLARTKTLEARFKAFNDGWVRGSSTFDATKHYYRPIPQSFLDAITDENGKALTAEQKDEMQNPGY